MKSPKPNTAQKIQQKRSNFSIDFNYYYLLKLSLPADCIEVLIIKILKNIIFRDQHGTPNNILRRNNAAGEPRVPRSPIVNTSLHDDPRNIIKVNVSI